ncbi:DUF6538 domain-containing protein [Sphingomonas sp. IW22]|uniref:DUF6538 domain-containing protein n=1 Tax=Sphingomonas sp. IW22 TaxID=3242489 RepID=UPI00351FFEDF
MSHSVRRANSRFEQFRMAVPADIRDLVGKREWTHSLETTDPTLAAARRASHSAHYKAEILRLRSVLSRQAKTDAATLVDRAFTRFATYSQSMDNAVAGELMKIATIVRSSWSVEHARAVEQQHLGEAQTGYYDPEPTPIPAIDDENERRLFCIRAEIFEGRNLPTDGLVYQELARALLARGVFQPLRFAVEYLQYVVPEIDITTRDGYDRVAEAYLTRLAEHEFESWPQNIREALAPIAQPPSPARPEPAIVSHPAPVVVSGPSLYDAFDEWKRRKGIVGNHKTADEFETAIRRFEILCGTSDVTLITTEMVEGFGDTVAMLPSRPKKEIANLPLLEQIARAEANSLPTLSPPTVGKQVGAIKAVLSVARRKKWISHNPAADVVIEGAKWQGDERDHFSDDDLHRIYTSPLMTDPDACSDTMFWILFLAPFHGSRPGEHCKLKPNEVVRDDGAWVMRFRRDRRQSASANPTDTPRRQKTRNSIRDVPLHWIVLEGGFIDFVSHQRKRGAAWLFDDLKVDRYGDRYKLLSRDINKALRQLGITEVDKAFYSTRHTMKREGRRRRITKQSLDQLAGHASSDVGDRYGGGLPIDMLKEDIDRLEFRSVPWDAVVACALARVARLSAQRDMRSSAAANHYECH